MKRKLKSVVTSPVTHSTIPMYQPHTVLPLPQPTRITQFYVKHYTTSSTTPSQHHPSSSHIIDPSISTSTPTTSFHQIAIPFSPLSSVTQPLINHNFLPTIPQAQIYTSVLPPTHVYPQVTDFAYQPTLSHCFGNSDYDATDEFVWNEMIFPHCPKTSPIYTPLSTFAPPKRTLSKHATIFIPIKHRTPSSKAIQAVILPPSPDMARATCIVNFLLRTQSSTSIHDIKTPRLHNTMCTLPLTYTLTRATRRAKQHVTCLSPTIHHVVPPCPLVMYIRDHIMRIRETIALFSSLSHMASIRTSHSHLLSVYPIRSKQTQRSANFTFNPSYIHTVYTVMSLPTCIGRFILFIMSILSYFSPCLRAGRYMRLGIG